MKVVFGGCNIAQYIKISHVKKKTVILLKVERQCKNIKHGLIIITSKLRIHFHWKIDAVTRKNVEIIESYKSNFFLYSFFLLWLYVYQISGFKSCYKTFIFQGNVYWNCNFDLGCSRWMSLLIKNIWSLVFRVFINVWPAFMVYTLSCLDRFRAHVTYIFLLIWNAEEMGKSK